jgi:hypothetical protein
VNTHDEREDYDDEPRDRPLAPEGVMRWPASVMWAFGLFQFIGAQVVAAFLVALIVFFNFIDGDETLSSFWDHVQTVPELGLFPLSWILATVWTFLLMRSANDMRQFRHYNSVVLAVIMFTLSVPFVFLAIFQLPIGLAILTVLLQRDVRARFEAVARGKMNAAPPEAPDARTN